MSGRLRARDAEGGFTLVELVLTVAIVGILVVALTGVLIEYFKVTQAAASRMTETHDVQFASAYWQRDVASIGVRSPTYDKSASVHSFPLLQSVADTGNTGISPACALPLGTRVVTLAWSAYTSTNSTQPPTTVTVSYIATQSGTRYALTRVRCTGSTKDSTVQVADNLKLLPVVSCPGGCNGVGASVPTIVNLQLTVSDPASSSTEAYDATLTGQRRET